MRGSDIIGGQVTRRRRGTQIRLTVRLIQKNCGRHFLGFRSPDRSQRGDLELSH